MNYNFENKKIISFDIFDTLIYRLVSKPEDIFSIVKEKYKDTYGALDEDYKYLRQFAESKARSRTQSNEISFVNIFDELPYDLTVRKRLKELEFEVEKEHLVLNHKIYQFIKEQKKLGLNIVLISDMYYSKEEIIELLHTVGCDINLFQAIIVSSDYNASKAKGDLYLVYKEMFVEYSTDDMVHIGDNYHSDVVSAQNAGIEAVYYEDIIEDILSIYALEESWFGESIPQLRSLRKLVNGCNFHNKEEEQLFNIGSQIFGPVYTLFIEWVIQYAEKKGVKKICPLMREGALFSKMLNIAIEKKQLTIDVTPLYVSRKATYLPSLKTFDEQTVEELLKRRKLALRDLFDLLQIDIGSTLFNKYTNINIEQSKQIYLNDSSLYDLLIQFLCTEDVKNKVQINIQNQKELFKRYIDEITNKQEFITVDLAGYGSIQKQLDFTLNGEYNTHHLMILGRLKTLQSKIEGHNFSTWLGYNDKKNPKIKSFFRSPEIIEAVTNIAEPGTSKYQLENNVVCPVKTNIIYPMSMLKKQEKIWDGIFAFQKEWLYLDEAKNLKNILLLNREGFLTIFSRLINYPLQHEVELLGSLIQDDFSHFSRQETIIRNSDKDILKEMGIEEFKFYSEESYYESEIYWPQGVISSVYPEYIIEKTLREKQLDNTTRDIYLTVLKLKKINVSKLCIYGAGEIGRKVAYFCNVNGIKIDSFIDKNYANSSEQILGIPIRGKEYLDESVDCILIGSKAFFEEIKKELNGYYLNKKVPEIIGVFSKK